MGSLLAVAAALLAADLPGAAAGRVGVTTEFDAPAAGIVRVFGDVTRYPAIFPAVKRVEVRHRLAGRLQSYAEIEFPWPVGTRWLLAEIQASGDRVRWRRLDGSIRRFDGTLAVSGLSPGRSRAVLDATIDPGWAAPGWLASFLGAQAIDGMVADARRYLRDHADEVAQRTSAR